MPYAGQLVFYRNRYNRIGPHGESMKEALSDLEVLILSAVLRLGPDAYGVSIREAILERTGRSVSIGSLYKAIHRLEKRGLVKTVVGEPTAVRGGRARKHVMMEEAGRRALQDSVRALSRMLDGLAIDLRGR